MSKVVIVTGGSRGIGAANSMLLASKGYAVCVNYHTRSLKRSFWFPKSLNLVVKHLPLPIAHTVIKRPTSIAQSNLISTSYIVGI
jgi:NAD(P)-dependent dehydrogenase (short-subunit alcohol dehydrogenase family)